MSEGEPQPEPAPGRRPFTRFEWGCVAVVLVAFVLRLDFLLEPAWIWDSAWLLMLSQSLMEDGSFWIRWQHEPRFYSGYWPPLFPVFLLPFVKAFGASYGTINLAAITASGLLTIAVFFTTRDLFGRTRAFAAAALIACNPAFYTTDSSGMSESLLALMVTLAAWAFLKSLKQPVYLGAAAVFGALAYLGKANLGLPILGVGLAALGGWRVYHRGRALLRSPVDLAFGALVVGGLATIGFTRTERLGGIGFGGVIEPVQKAISEPFWVPVFLFKVAFAASFLLVVTLPLSLHVLKAARAKKDEATGALWLAAAFPLAAGAIFTTSFYFTEHRNIVDFDNIRYLTPSIVPMLWILLPHWPGDKAHGSQPQATENAHLRRQHERWYFAAVGAFFLLLLLNPNSGPITLGRLIAFLFLATIPFALAIMALTSHVATQRRKRADGAEVLRFVPDKAPATPRRAALTVGAFLALLLLYAFVGPIEANEWVLYLVLATPIVLGLLAIDRRIAGTTGTAGLKARAPQAFTIGLLVFALALSIQISSWYAAVTIGLGIALAHASPRASVLTMALVLVAATTPAVHTPYPAPEAAAALDPLPEATNVGLSEPIIYTAAVAPWHVNLWLVDPGVPIPDHIDVLLVSTGYEHGPYPGFVEVTHWDYQFSPSETVKWRLWIEEHVLGRETVFQGQRGLTMFVKEDSPAAAVYGVAS